MSELVSTLAAAGPLTIALVACVLLILIVGLVIRHALGKRKVRSFRHDTGPVITREWMERAEFSFKRGHTHAGELMKHELRLSQLQKDVSQLTVDAHDSGMEADKVMERLIKVESKVDSLREDLVHLEEEAKEDRSITRQEIQHVLTRVEDVQKQINVNHSEIVRAIAGLRS